MTYSIKFCNALGFWTGGNTQMLCVCFRSFTFSSLNLDKNQAREARFMKKLMGKTNTVKKTWYRPHDDTPVTSGSKPFVSKPAQNHRRISVLNKLFMRYISDVMSTGEVSNHIVGRGIELSRVQTAPDFNRINVFWLARDKENDAEVQEILEKYSWQLRHELTQLRVIGIVPPIYFIKDKQYAKVAEVNRILATADFGEDYVPVDVGYQFKSEFTEKNYSKLSPELMRKIQELEQEEEPDQESPEPPLPPMRSDVFGLKHDVIMENIKKGMKKSKALHRHDPDHSLAHPSSDELPVQDENVSIQKRDLEKFILRQQILKKKAFRGKKNYTPEMEMYESELLDNSKVANDFMENVTNDKDYYLDDFEDKSRN